MLLVHKYLNTKIRMIGRTRMDYETGYLVEDLKTKETLFLPEQNITDWIPYLGTLKST